MNPVDIVLILCFIPAVISGLRKGFITQIAGIIIIIAGIWLSFEFSETVSAWISGWWEAANPEVLKIVSFAVIFIVVALLLTLVTRLIEKLLNAILLGWLNKLLGFLFAILKYSIILGILAYFFNIINGSGKIVPVHLLDNSIIYGLLCKLNELIFPYLQGFINSF